MDTTLAMELVFSSIQVFCHSNFQIHMFFNVASFDDLATHEYMLAVIVKCVEEGVDK